jgi:hypothetical protein
MVKCQRSVEFHFSESINNNGYVTTHSKISLRLYDAFPKEEPMMVLEALFCNRFVYFFHLLSKPLTGIKNSTANRKAQPEIRIEAVFSSLDCT